MLPVRQKQVIIKKRCPKLFRYQMLERKKKIIQETILDISPFLKIASYVLKKKQKIIFC